MPKIAVLASFNMDLVMRVERRPESGETLQGDFAMHLGGKGFNQAVAARRLGAVVVVTGRVGDDDFGRMFLAALDDEGIDRRAVVIDPTAGTGVATIYVEPDGANTIVQSPRANLNTTASDISHALPYLEDAAIGMTQRELSIDGTRRFLQLLQPPTSTIFNTAPAGLIPPDVLAMSHILIANQIEAATLTGLACATQAECLSSARALLDSRQLVAITMGIEGSLGVTPDGETFAAAYDVPVVDTTGAGDAFCAALAVRLAEGAELPDAMRFANAAGALACTQHGAYPSMPHRPDVEALIAAQGSSR
jgi:ribokinase